MAGELGGIEHVTIVGSVGIGIDPGVGSKLHVLAANNSCGVLTQAGVAEGSSIGLHVNSTGFSSLAKNAFYSGSWNRFDSANGAFLLEVDPDGDTSVSTAPPGAGAIFGDIVTTGNVSMGYEIVQNVCDGSTCSAICPAGKKVIGGGCSSLFDEVRASTTFGDGAGWTCDYSGGDGVNVSAICVNIN